MCKLIFSSIKRIPYQTSFGESNNHFPHLSERDKSRRKAFRILSVYLKILGLSTMVYGMSSMSIFKEYKSVSEFYYSIKLKTKFQILVGREFLIIGKNADELFVNDLRDREISNLLNDTYLSYFIF